MGVVALASVSALVAVACSFSVPGLGLDEERTDLGAADLAVADGPMAVEDLAPPPPDLTPAVDLAGAVLPSFLPYTVVDANAADLDKVVLIDTSALMLQREGDSALRAPPAGVGFQLVNGIAVLSVGKMNIDRQLRVVGGAPLSIVAAAEIVVNAEVFANAALDLPGPGGWPSGTGPGAGPMGTSGMNGDDSGGAGGSYGTRGGRGGTGGMAMGPASSMTYGDTIGATLRGGSGGGRGADAASCIDGRGRGGGGGGALQFFSSIKITVTGAAGIYANGGGGRGGCATNDIGTAGGGGGSGGTLVFEAPSIEVKSGGWIFAHGSSYLASPTLGGAGAIGGGAGGGGAFIDSPAGDGLFGTYNGGGGGGGLGRIFFRTRGAAASIAGGAIVKPAGVSATTL